MRLRDVDLGDVDTYVRIRCDAEMMAHLGGPLPREGIEEKVRRDVEQTAADIQWIKMIELDRDGTEVTAGSVCLWSHESLGRPMSEVGWSVLPEFQGRGVAKAAVRALLEAARDDGRWGPVHAFPATTNAPSNGLCRSLGFRFEGPCEVTFGDRLLHTNHWVVDPASLPA